MNHRTCTLAVLLIIMGVTQAFAETITVKHTDGKFYTYEQRYDENTGAKLTAGPWVLIDSPAKIMDKAASLRVEATALEAKAALLADKMAEPAPKATVEYEFVDPVIKVKSEPVVEELEVK